MGYIYQLQFVEKNKNSIIEESRKINIQVPIVKTNDFGHMHGNSIIPIGVEVKINSKDKSFTLGDYIN